MSETPGYRQTARRLLAAATLVCGMKMDQLLEQVADGSAAARDAHQRGCPYCQAALGELAVMWAPVAQLAAAPVTSAPGLNAPVMSQIRRSGQETWYSVRATNQGVIRIASRVVTVVARDSARLVPGVRVALCRGVRATSTALADRATHRSRPVTVTAPGGAAVDLAVTIGSGRPALDVARDVQRHVTANLRNSLGLDPVTVNVSVDDIAGAGQ